MGAYDPFSPKARERDTFSVILMSFYTVPSLRNTISPPLAVKKKAP